MTALRRMKVGSFGGIAAAVALALAAPAVAQSNDAPIDVTAAPPPSAETIGPSQLRDFNLRGTVTRPADRPAATPAQPVDTATAAPRNGEAVPGEAAARSAAPARSESTRSSTSSANVPVTTVSGRAGEPPITPSAPLEVTTDPAPQPAYEGSSALAPTGPSSGSGLLPWPWLAALIALAGGVAFIAWSRRSSNRRHGDPGRMAFAGLIPDADTESQPIPAAGPRPDPVPPRHPPQAAPRPDPVPPVAAPKPPSDGTIKSTRLKPQLNVEFQPDRIVVTEQELMLMYDMVISNVGSAPARDVLVEGRLFTAHFAQDGEISQFFQNPASSGDRMAAVAPLGRVSLKSVVRLPLDQVHEFEAGGRKLFVPMIGLNILYRAGGEEGQASASFLVGRGGEEDQKLAPFRIDQRPRIFRDLSARPHSLGLQTA